jgi:hypothetical protein
MQDSERQNTQEAEKALRAVIAAAEAEEYGAPADQPSTLNAPPDEGLVTQNSKLITQNSPARRSGGPRTPEGKKRSSLNALKHGLDAVSPHALDVLKEQAGITYEAIWCEVEDYYCPRDPIEGQLCKRIARCLYRLSLSESMEKRLLTRRAGPARATPSYDRVLKFERLVDIHLHRAITALRQKRESEKRLNPRNEQHSRWG